MRGEYSTARVSKRPTDQSAACLRARYCTDLIRRRIRDARRTLRFHQFSDVLDEIRRRADHALVVRDAIESALQLRMFGDVIADLFDGQPGLFQDAGEFLF